MATTADMIGGSACAKEKRKLTRTWTWELPLTCASQAQGCKLSHSIHHISHPRYRLAYPPLLHSVPAIMFRAAAVRALRVAARPQFTQQFITRPQVATSLLQNSRTAPSFVIPSIRHYSAPAGLSKEEVQGRIMDLLKNFDKVRHRN